MNKIVPQVALDAVELEMTRAGFGEGLVEAGKDPRVFALCADLTDSIKISGFAKAYPDRFIEIGVAEQNMMGIAAGLALTGKVPFVASYAVFNPGRNWDQLRVSVCYSKANVKIVGAHAGLSVGPDGATHQALEDIAITRVLPNLMVVVPTDAVEAKRAVLALVEHVGPAYIRFGRDKNPTITTLETPFILGKANLFREGGDITILANGPLVHQSLLAAARLSNQGIEADVIAVHTVKPLDNQAILESVRKTGAVITAEEAQATGGLGSAVAELLGEQYPAPLYRIGVRDSFGESGKPDELMKKFGLTADDIVTAAVALQSRKLSR